jgi:hypothetical protein
MGKEFINTNTSEGPSSHVDVYDKNSNTWTRHPKGLGQARNVPAAAALPSGIVIFAGGFGSNDRLCFDKYMCQFTIVHENNTFACW